jgi:chemotaxis signal transduction protein
VSAREVGPGATAQELRRRFDDVFSAPPATPVADITSFLTLNVGGDGYALRVAEIRGFAAARKVVPLPSPAHALLGLAGIRGVVVPVFSLRVLMGYDGQGDDRARWFVLCGAVDPIALAFADFEGYLELPLSDVRSAGESSRAHVRELLQAGGVLRGVIALASLTRTIEERAAAARPIKER